VKPRVFHGNSPHTDPYCYKSIQTCNRPGRLFKPSAAGYVGGPPSASPPPGPRRILGPILASWAAYEGERHRAVGPAKTTPGCVSRSRYLNCTSKASDVAARGSPWPVPSSPATMPSPERGAEA
jgi:hypothetical protein